jgi:hypothetical protein
MLRFLALFSLVSIPASAQAILAARSGVLNFSEGEVYIGETPVEQKFGKFPDVKEGAQLRTATGRAEVLLTPGVIVRLGPDSAIRMLSTSLIDTQLELRFGSAIVEVSEEPRGTSVTLSHRDYKVRFPVKGFFRLDAAPAQLLVFEGEAEVTLDGQKKLVAKNQRMPLTRALMAETFHQSVGDGLYEWTMRRSDKLAIDNAPPPPDTFDPGIAIGTLSLPASGGWYSNSPYTFSPYAPAVGAWNFGYGSPFGIYSALGMYPPYGIYGYLPGYAFGRFRYTPPQYPHLPGYRPPMHQPFVGTSGTSFRPPPVFSPIGRAPSVSRPAAGGTIAPRGSTARGR